MSVRAMAWAWEQRCPPGAKPVLLALADRSDDDGICWPGRRGIAERVGITPRSVTRHISSLIKLGILATIERTREDGSRTSNQYRLGVGPLMSPPLDSGVHTPWTPVSIPLDTSVHTRTIIEPSVEPSSPKKREHRPVDDDYIEHLVQKYQSQFGGNGDVRESIARAMNHKALLKAIDKRQYVEGWLRRDAKGYAASTTQGKTGFDNSQEKFRRLQRSDI